MLTKQSEKSIWVGFEFGYFWKKANKTHIYILRHPDVLVPEPLNDIEVKKVTEREEVDNFKANLCRQLNIPFANRTNSEVITKAAANLQTGLPERSLKRFEELLVYSEWSHMSLDFGFEDFREVWTCEDDALYQIVDRQHITDYHERWTESFPDPTAREHLIDLNISGGTIQQISFISVDGGRNFVRQPEIAMVEGKRVYYWDISSLALQVANVIARFDSPWSSIMRFAAVAKIEVTNLVR